MQEAAAGHSHLGEEGQDCSGNQGATAPLFHFVPLQVEVV